MGKNIVAAGIKIGSVAKAVRIIETIAKARRGMSIKELATELEMPKSTLHHIIMTLVETGFLAQDPLNRTYNIGFHLVEIGQAYLEQLDLRKVARPYLEQLSLAVKEVVHLLILDQGEVVYIDKVENHVQEGTLRCSSIIGRRASAYSTAAGKVLLSFLPAEALRNYLAHEKLSPKTEYTITSPEVLREQLVKIRSEKYAVDRQENEVGLHCVAVPIFNREEKCIAALSISGPFNRVSLERIEKELKDAAAATARQISAEFGYALPAAGETAEQTAREDLP